MKDRSFLEGELPRFRREDIRSRYVGREEVGGELDAMEAALYPQRKILNGSSLGEPRGAFHQKMAVRQEGDE